MKSVWAPGVNLLGLDLRDETNSSQSRWERENAQRYGLSNHDHACHPDFGPQLSPYGRFKIYSYSPPHHSRIHVIIITKW